MAHARRFAGLLLLALVAFGSAACVSTDLTGSLMPGVTLAPGDVYYVEKLEPDERGIEAVIRDQLTALGKTASSGPAGGAPPDATVVVTYQDRWMWDLRMYLLQLDIQFKNAKTGNVLATGKSYRTSLAAKSPEETAKEVLMQIFADEAANP